MAQTEKTGKQEALVRMLETIPAEREKWLRDATSRRINHHRRHARRATQARVARASFSAPRNVAVPFPHPSVHHGAEELMRGPLLTTSRAAAPDAQPR